jgi:outer membrane autotransporter protein
LQASNSINISAGEVRLYGGSELTADTVFFTNNVLLTGNTPSPSDPTPEPEALGRINANVVYSGGTIDLRSNTLAISGDASFGAGTNILTKILPNAYGNITVGGIGTIDNNSTVTPTIAGGFVPNGQSFTLISNTTGAPTLINSPGLIQFSLSDATGDLVLTSHLDIPTEVGVSLTSAGRNALDAVFNYTGNDPAFMQMGGEIINLSSTEMRRAAERLRPEIHDGAFRLLLNNTDRMLGIVDSHLFETHMAGIRGESTPVTQDNLPTGAGIWAQGFGMGGTQDGRDNSDGYSLSSTGVAIGADRTIGDKNNLRLGIAGSIGSGNVDNSGITDTNRIDITSYLGAVYASWAIDEWYLNGAVGLGRHVYETERNALNRFAQGSHDGWQFTAKVDVGWPLQWNEDITLVPLASLSYNHFYEEDYSEKGTTSSSDLFNLNETVVTTSTTPIALRINKRQFDSLRSGLGGKILWNIQQPEWNAGIELRALYSHEFGDVAQDSTARFVAGGPSFSSPGIKPARDGIVLGSSVRLTGNDDNDQVTLLASYDADIREQFFGHALTMMLRYDFDQGPSYVKRANARKAALLNRAVPAIQVKATEQDIAAINQAMQPGASNQDVDPETTQAELAVSAAIDSWLDALTNKNMDSYFNSYAANFATPDGSSRLQWERKRRTEISREGNPIIKVSYMTVKPQGDQASAVFTQTLQNGDAREVALKSVDLIEKNGRWLIVKEDSMPIPE